MKLSKNNFTILISGLVGLISALILTKTLYHQYLSSIFDWIFAISLLTLGFVLVYFALFPRAWQQFIDVQIAVKIWALLLLVPSILLLGYELSPIFMVICIPVAFVLIAPGLSSFQGIIKEKRIPQFAAGNALGGAVIFILAGFFQNFYPTVGGFVSIVIILNLLLTPMIEIVLAQNSSTLQNRAKEKIIIIAVISFGILFIVLTFLMLSQYPTFFQPKAILLTASRIPIFMCIIILSQSWTAIIVQKLRRNNFHNSSFVYWIKQHLPGLILSSSISISTYLLATSLVSDNLGLIDNFFDTDSPLWVNYLTADAGQVYEVRAAHPFVLLILRPLVSLISFFLNGNDFHAALLLNSFTGGVCIFLAWWLVKQRTENVSYALLISALLGFSSSHLILSVFLESYIFSAVALISFILLLQKNTKFTHLALSGLITFGITITNFIQICIAHFVKFRDFKSLLKYILFVLGLAVLLSFTQSLLYPLSQPFYIFRNLANESVYGFNLFEAAFDVVIARANMLVRSIGFFSIIAPHPLISLKEAGCSYPCFNTVLDFGQRYQFASYIGYSGFLARLWFVFLIAGSGMFIWQLYKSPSDTASQVSFILILIFNFILHMNYGDDPILYSPNWTYALVFFFGISFEKLSGQLWFQILLLLFVAAVSLNNLEVFQKLLETISKLSVIGPS